MSVEYISAEMVKSTAWLVSHLISTTYSEFGQITFLPQFPDTYLIGFCKD